VYQLAAVSMHFSWHFKPNLLTLDVFLTHLITGLLFASDDVLNLLSNLSVHCLKVKGEETEYIYVHSKMLFSEPSLLLCCTTRPDGNCSGDSILRKQKHSSRLSSEETESLGAFQHVIL
jgi:hypothetical protein